MPDMAAHDRQSTLVDLGPLDDSTGFLLRLAQLQSFEAFFAGMADTGLKPGEYSTLLVIGRNPGIRQGQLARTLSIKRAHMTKMVKGMERSGLVHRSTPPDDRRAVELSLTQKAQDRLQRHRAAFQAQEAANMGGLTPLEADRLRHLLRKYLRVVQAQTSS